MPGKEAYLSQQIKSKHTSHHLSQGALRGGGRTFFWSGLVKETSQGYPTSCPVSAPFRHPTNLRIEKMSEAVSDKIKNYRTAPFDARFPNTNQTRNCFQNYLDFHRCNKALTAKGQDVFPCEWYQRIYKSLCPISWVSKWDEQIENGSFPGKI